MTSKWVQLSSMPGNFTVKVSGGTAAFLEAPFPPAETKGGMTFADCLISFNTRDCLWVRPVSGDPSVEITGAGIGAVIPLSADVAGTAEPSDWDNAETHTRPSGNETASSSPSWYYVIVIAGQSNASSYGEGLPLPDSYDRPDPRIMQLARRNTQTPGGIPCKYNEIIPADHCLHDVQNMSLLNHPKADLKKGQYGCVGQGLHIAKKVLPVIPADAGILLVPCARGGSAFTTGAVGSFDPASGAAEASLRWGVDTPLYQDLVSRTKAALEANPKNVLLSVVWIQGEGDLKATPAQHGAQFTAMVKKFRADLGAFSGQCIGGSSDSVPWLCGDTTYDWKEKNPAAYETIYSGYKNRASENIHFVPLMHDEFGNKTATNLPEHDPDIASAGYYGAESRGDGNWTTASRATHFSSWARRFLVSDRFASAILKYAGLTSAFIAGVAPDGEALPQPAPGGKPEAPTGSQPGGSESPHPTSPSLRTLLSLKASAGEVPAQGWKITDGTIQLTDEGKALTVSKQSGKTWTLTHGTDAAGELLKHGGQLTCKFRLSGEVKEGQFALGIYLHTDTVPEGVTMSGTGTPFLMAYYLQTTGGQLNLMHHKTGGNTKLGSFGAYNNQWHTLVLKFTAGSAQVTPVLDGTPGQAFQMVKDALSPAKDTLTLTDVTKGATYGVSFESVVLEVNTPAA